MMPRPAFVLKQICTLTTATRSTDYAGAPTATTGSAYTVKCSLQPEGSALGMGDFSPLATTIYSLFLDLVSRVVDATTLTIGLVVKDTIYAIDGVNYEAVGDGYNPCSYSGCLKVTVQRVR